jgi:hypothetical protein
MSGEPDSEILERLISIHRQAGSEAVRVAALGSMTGQVNPGRSVAYLGSVATSPSAMDAGVALIQLDRIAFKTPKLGTAEDRQRAEQIIQSLIETGLFKSRAAASLACEIAHTNPTWKTGPTCSSFR